MDTIDSDLSSPILPDFVVPLVRKACASVINVRL
jgi:hypothetical protein